MLAANNASMNQLHDVSAFSSVTPSASAPALVLVTETWPPEINGVAMTLSRLMQGMLQRGWRVQLVRPRQRSDRDAGAAPLAVNQGIEQILVPGLPIPGYGSLRFGMPMYEKLRHAWKYQRPQVVHIATEGPLGWAALKAARSLDIPVTSSFHTNFHRYCSYYRMDWLRGLVTRHLREFHNQCALTMVPNATLAALLQQEQYQNVVVLGRGVDVSLFSPARRSAALRQQWGLSEQDLAVIYVGRMAAEKSLDVVVRAFEAIEGKQPKARMIWVGDGPEMKRLRKRYPHHVFCGSQLGEALATHYASADLFLFASMTETFGNVVTEAMASGLAVVAYDYAAPAMVIHSGQNGCLVPFGDAVGFMETAQMLAADAALQQRLRIAAPASLQQHAWSEVCDLFDRYLHEAVERAVLTVI